MSTRKGQARESEFEPGWRGENRREVKYYLERDRLIAVQPLTLYYPLGTDYIDESKAFGSVIAIVPPLIPLEIATWRPRG